MSEQLIPLLVRLCVLLEAQTEAINALAASNQEIVDAMVGQEGDDRDPDSPGVDMSGRPIKVS